MKGKRKIDRERDIDGTKKEEGRDSYCKDVEFGVEMCFFVELGTTVYEESLLSPHAFFSQMRDRVTIFFQSSLIKAFIKVPHCASRVSM